MNEGKLKHKIKGIINLSPCSSTLSNTEKPSPNISHIPNLHLDKINKTNKLNKINKIKISKKSICKFSARQSFYTNSSRSGSGSTFCKISSVQNQHNKHNQSSILQSGLNPLQIKGDNAQSLRQKLLKVRERENVLMKNYMSFRAENEGENKDKCNVSEVNCDNIAKKVISLKRVKRVRRNKGKTEIKL